MEIKNCPLPAIGLNKESKIIEFNENAKNILGSDIKGVYLKDFVHPSSLETLEKILMGKISHGIIVLFTLTGEKDYRVYRVQEEWGLVFILIDISTEVKLTGLLEKQREYFLLRQK